MYVVVWIPDPHSNTAFMALGRTAKIAKKELMADVDELASISQRQDIPRVFKYPLKHSARRYGWGIPLKMIDESREVAGPHDANFLQYLVRLAFDYTDTNEFINHPIICRIKAIPGLIPHDIYYGQVFTKKIETDDDLALYRSFMVQGGQVIETTRVNIQQLFDTAEQTVVFYVDYSDNYYEITSVTPNWGYRVEYALEAQDANRTTSKNDKFYRL